MPREVQIVAALALGGVALIGALTVAAGTGHVPWSRQQIGANVLPSLVVARGVHKFGRVTGSPGLQGDRVCAPHGLCRMTLVACVAAAGLVGATSAATSSSVFVRADRGWTNTGIVVRAGTDVTADGQAITISPVNPVVGQPSLWAGHSGPDGQPFTCSAFTDANGAHPCLLEGAPYGALVGMVEAQVFVVGSQGTVPASGVLNLGVNDNAGFFLDNDGGYAGRVG